MLQNRFLQIKSNNSSENRLDCSLLDVDILGSNALIVGSDNSRIRTTDHPIAVGSVHFGMFFNCSLIHPTVVFRRRVLDAFLYDDDDDDDTPHATTVVATNDDNSQSRRRRQSHVEDYSLWLRVVCSNRFKIANIAQPLLRLRKHASNVSSVHAAEQRAATISLRASVLRIVSPTATREASTRLAQLMAAPESLSSFDDAKELVAMIDKLVQFLNVKSMNAIANDNVCLFFNAIILSGHYACLCVQCTTALGGVRRRRSRERAAPGDRASC
jgi:hypothetical protein